MSEQLHQDSERTRAIIAAAEEVGRLVQIHQIKDKVVMHAADVLTLVDLVHELAASLPSAPMSPDA